VNGKLQKEGKRRSLLENHEEEKIVMEDFQDDNQKSIIQEDQ